MSKQLYEEALADVKKVTEVAEDNAKRAILEVVTPRIRELIERELLSEHEDEEDDLLFDNPVSPAATESNVADAISTPDAEGKVTLDIDVLAPCAANDEEEEEEEYELGMESVDAVAPLLDIELKNVGENVRSMLSAGRLVRESRGYIEKISKMISQVEAMYEHVQESIVDPARKNGYEQKLESYFKDLTELQENTMAKKTQLRDLIKEEESAEQPKSCGNELTLKLTGLPADVDLDTVGVDLVTGGEEPAAEPEASEPAGDEEVDLGDLDLGAEDEDEEGKQDQMEVTKLSDDTIVEIDENMLRREINRMRRLREVTVEKPVEGGGHGVDAAEMEMYGGGKDEGEPFVDGEVTTEAEDMDDQDQEDLDEQDDQDLDEQDQQDDLDQGYGMDQDDDDDQDMDELQNRRKGEELGHDVADGHLSMESLCRRLAFEGRVRARARSRARSLKQEAKSAKSPAKRAAIKKEYARAVRRFNESVRRSNRLQKVMTESVSLRKESRTNRASSKPAESKAVNVLRNKLAEQRLLNVKLTYATKLLQNESLTKRQKAFVIDKLDEASSVAAVKLVYENLAKQLERRPMQENAERKLLSSASQASRPASTQTSETLTEGFETERWAKLAGIQK